MGGFTLSCLMTFDDSSCTLPPLSHFIPPVVSKKFPISIHIPPIIVGHHTIPHPARGCARPCMAGWGLLPGYAELNEFVPAGDEVLTLDVAGAAGNPWKLGHGAPENGN